MKSILKWPGGKDRELPVIKQYMPPFTGRYVEPFVGGGALFFDLEGHDCYLNDKSNELINLYRCVQKQDEDFRQFLQKAYDEFQSLGGFVATHSTEVLALYLGQVELENFLARHQAYFTALAQKSNGVLGKELRRNLKGKIQRSAKLEQAKGALPDEDRLANMESALKSAYYMYMRYLYNHAQDASAGVQAALFFFIREYCYSSMFRYNAKGEFNVPYGGISYNNKDFQKKIDYLFSAPLKQKLHAASFQAEDFEIFMEQLHLTTDDFVFLDPPYDSDFSTYAKNQFGHAEQARLCACLKKTQAKCLLIIKNTDFIYDLYKENFRIRSFDNRYRVSFMNRNDKETKHLIITNY